MATPKPGEIRCPTCHRSTQPAAFCTQCGSAIPPDARIRPRGMDREELQERIRARRSGGDPYRRGGTVDDERGGYERFEPDPNDARARRGRGGEERRTDHFREAPPPPPVVPPAAAQPTGDLTRDREDWARPAPAVPPPVAAPPPAAATVTPAAEEPAHVDHFDDEAYEDADYPYDYPEYEEWEQERERRSGAGAFAILGFLALGVLALLGGAALAGVFGTDPGGVANATPTPAFTAEPTLAETPQPTAGEATPVPTGEPGGSGDPVVFPDGFTAEAQPCLPGSAGGSGCASNGTNNNGVVDIWVGFQNGTGSDVIGATLVAPDGSTVDGSIDLARINCGQSCNGWTYFPFRNLTPGQYEVQITRNGQPASSTSFEVS